MDKGARKRIGGGTRKEKLGRKENVDEARRIENKGEVLIR